MTDLVGDTVELRTLNPGADEHVQLFVDTRNDPRMHSTDDEFTRMTHHEARDAITGMCERDTAAHMCAIYADDRPVGWCSLDMVGDEQQTGTLGYYVLPEFQGNGYATDAVGLLTDAAFTDLDAENVHASIRADNAASLRVVEKLDFRPANRNTNAGSRDEEYVEMIRWKDSNVSGR